MIDFYDGKDLVIAALLEFDPFGLDNIDSEDIEVFLEKQKNVGGRAPDIEGLPIGVKK